MIEEKCETQAGRAKLILMAAVIVSLFATVLAWLFIDERFFSWLSRHRPAWSSVFWLEGLKLLGKNVLPIWLLLIWAVVSKRYRPAMVALLATLIVLLMVMPLKVLTQRQRPKHNTAIQAMNGQVPEVADKPRRSFPSGDTAGAFAVATALAPFLAWGWGTAFFAAGAGVALMRVIDLAHYPSDILAGAAVGIFCGLLARQLARRYLSSESPKSDRLFRLAVMLAVFLIPVSIVLFSSSGSALLFFKTSGVLIAGGYLAGKAPARLKLLSKH